MATEGGGAKVGKTTKDHLSVVVCGHVDAGKSTTTGRLIYDLGGLSKRDMEKLAKAAADRGMDAFKYAYAMDTQEDERARGVTISCTAKEFFTDSYHYTIIDAPGHVDFIKNMIVGSSQADAGLLLVPADGNFTKSIAKGGKGADGELEMIGQTRQHAMLLNLLGVKQLVIGVNKMDAATAGYSEDRFIEIRDEMRHMLRKVGWKKDMVANVPILPISGWAGDNLIDESANMPWWGGIDVTPLSGGAPIHVHTLVDALDKFVQPPARKVDAPLRIPVTDVFKLKGKGTIVTGRIEQGSVTKGTKVVFLPSHRAGNQCAGSVFSIEMHHTAVEVAIAGDNVGICVKGLADIMPKKGDIMVAAEGHGLAPAASFDCMVQVLNHPGELKIGYAPIGYVKSGKSAVRLSAIKWAKGKSTGGAKVENPLSIKAGDVAEVTFEPQQPLVVEPFKACEGLGRVAIMESNFVVMIGKVSQVSAAHGAAPAGGGATGAGA